MADNTAAKAQKLQKQLEEQQKKTETCQKQLDKLAAMSKKAFDAAKKVDQLWK
jgi:hypothetical protein